MWLKITVKLVFVLILTSTFIVIGKTNVPNIPFLLPLETISSTYVI